MARRIRFASLASLVLLAACDESSVLHEESLDDADPAATEEFEDDDAHPLASAYSIVDADGEEVGPAVAPPGRSPDLDLDLSANLDPVAGYVGGEAIIVQVNSGMCLQAHGSANWSYVRQEYCDYGPAQQWDVQASVDLSTNQTVLRFENELTGLCLHSNNGWLRQVACGPTDSQAFVDYNAGAAPGIWVLQSRGTSRCLNIPYGHIDPEWVQDYDCVGSPNEQWVINVQASGQLCQ
ncbi:MAG: RICIN domain-containing protein [Nannocystales bacterium]